MSRHPTWDPSTDPDARVRGYNAPRTRRWWRDVLLPRTTIPLGWLAWLVLAPAGLGRRRRPDDHVVALESGVVGWTHVYFEELWASAAEYVGGEERLVRAVVDRDAEYLPQFRAWVADSRITHAVVDVRTGPQSFWAALRASAAIAWTLRRRSVVPIIVLPDAGVRLHRHCAAILTMHGGVVLTFMDDRLVRRAFPHRRIVGPLPMPVSKARLESLRRMRENAHERVVPVVRFVGGDYEPRRTFVDELTALLGARGIVLDVNRDKAGTTNDEYWELLATCDVMVTTVMQGLPRDTQDWIWVPQLVFRCIEALAAGAALCSPEVPGGERWYVPGVDFVPFGSLDDAADVIERIVRDPAELARLRAAGLRTATRIIDEQAFFSAADAVLGPDAVRR